MPDKLQAPFIYFGGKSTIASIVWQRFGNVANYVEPFFGSGAVLLGRPHEPDIETISDADGFVANFWRSVQSDPETVAYYADYPAIEHDLHARHAWLVGKRNSLSEQLEGDPDYYDAKIAGWWCWGINLWIGGGFCSGNGRWQHLDGKLVKRDDGQGVHKKLIHLGDAGKGVQKRRIHLGDAGKGVHKKSMETGIYDWMQSLAHRLRRVRVSYGDWKRITGPSVTFKNGITGVFLDPPYGEKANRAPSLYAVESLSVASECLVWCVENGHHPMLRIALCGYEGEHDVLAQHGWTLYRWKAQGGMAHTGNGRGRENAKREVIWFSPHCIKDTQMTMF